MTRSHLEAAFDQLQGGLEGLLACLDARDTPEVAVLEAAWQHVQRGFERVRDEIEDLTGSRAPFQERLERCLRLYAVAAGVLARQRDTLAAERAACSDARARLKRSRPSSSGGSCDLRG